MADRKEKKKEQLALRRQQQKDKRSAKQTCHICKQTGHTRRECPGIEDGGKGQVRWRYDGS